MQLVVTDRIADQAPRLQDSHSCRHRFGRVVYHFFVPYGFVRCAVLDQTWVDSSAVPEAVEVRVWDVSV
ncbi:MAG: hypothetical protein CBE00_05700 [Planctomycetaceae bacterium TMED240]|nr:hypothetical protein [Rhodopirellula sp.]OUX07238.1 MAG: hypothetical protein CBE00_05700 [Planctomycetaceae bacterium TMED240]